MKQCIEKGMISGRRQAVDGFFIKANASLDSLIQKEIMDDAVVYSAELKANEENDTAQVSSINKQDEDAGLKPKKNPSNDTHYNPSDPDARMSVKPGKPTTMNYLGQIAVDTATHMITHVQAFTADKRDSECLPAVHTHVKSNLHDNELALQEMVADTGYSSGDALKALQAAGITGYIPNRGQFNYEREGVTYRTEGDYYECANGRRLTYRGTVFDGVYFMKRYLVSRKECRACPFKTACSAYGKKASQIRETIDKPYYDVMHLRMQTRKAKRLMKLRQSTVEPVIGTLVNYLGIKKVNTKGLSQANKCITMAAVAYNLKKMLKLQSKSIESNLKSIKTHSNKMLNALSRLTIPFTLFSMQ